MKNPLTKRKTWGTIIYYQKYYERGDQSVEKHENKTGICAVADVKVSLWKYEYAPFKNSGSNEKSLCAFRKMLDTGEFPKDTEYDASFVARYCADVIEECICCAGELEAASDTLVKVYGYCRKRLSGVAPFVAIWLCGLYLSKGECGGLQRLLELGIGGFPFEKDVAAGKLICAFLRGDRVMFREKLPLVLPLLSVYDITKSVVYSKDVDICRKALDAVILSVFDFVLSENGKSMFLPNVVTVRIQAFPGLPCRCECERLLDVKYIPFSECGELFGLIDLCVRHTDNLLRQGFGIKSKIVGFTLASEYRKLVSDTIRETIPGFLPMPMKVGRKPKEKTLKERIAKQKEPVEVFEPIDLNIDLTKAKKLEAESWKLADMLSGDYGGNDISFNVDEIYNGVGKEFAESDAENAITVEALASNTDDSEGAVKTDNSRNIPEDWQELYGLLTEDEKMILCLCANGVDVSAFARKRGGMPEGYADSVNEKASDAYGDIIVETDGRNIYFIEDYKDELTEIFRDMYNTEVL